MLIWKKIIHLNYKEKISSLEQSVKFWSRRSLTPIGRCTVIKCLLLPIFNHLFISLPDPDDKMLKSISDILYNFLWHGPAKVKKSVVT